MRFIAIVALLFIVSFAACSSAGNGSSPNTNLSQLMAVPQSISFSTQPGQQTTVQVSGGASPYTIRAQDGRLVALGAPETVGSAVSFSVTPVASGATEIAVTDSRGGVATVSVTTQICTPPAPELFLSYPAPSALSVPATTTKIWAAEPDTDPMLANVGTFALRLVASDGTTINGGNFQTSSSAPPTGSVQPPSGATYTYTTSAISGLRAGLTYQVQLTNAAYPCMPPTMLGQFST